MQKIGIDLLFPGIESGSNKMLRIMGKRHTNKDIIKGLNVCLRTKMNVAYPIVLGCPKESYKTLKETEDLTDYVFKKYKGIIRYFLISIVVPVVGSELFKLCLSNKKIINNYHEITNRNLSKDDFIDYTVLQRLMINEFCSVDMDKLIEFKNKLYLKYKIKETFSWKTEF